MKTICYSITVIFCLVFTQTLVAQPVITTGSLLQEMIDLDRLTVSPDVPYHSVQYSSYDRSSVSPEVPGWFANADGFGGEPIPNFQKVLKEPGQDGIGEYLICDVKGSGAIVRLWTAVIKGSIKLYLDGKLIYHGDAQKFFWEFPTEINKKVQNIDTEGTLRQFDALYFPIPFANSCRMEWIGNVKNPHFYHVGIRIYDQKTKVKTFRPADIETYRPEIDRVISVMKDPGKELVSKGERQEKRIIIPKGEKMTLVRIDGGKAIDELNVRINTNIPDIILRQSVLRIYFDDAPIPQVESPVGDFFGAAPGINPYVSMPLSVALDGTMSSRFVMPFKKSALVQIENMSDQNIEVFASASAKPYRWDDARSMYFRAHWRVNHNLTSSKEHLDIPFVIAMGEGRLVGAACYLMNPSNRVRSTWWGEGDEKIYVDNAAFPVFFGTGTEDYFNYSWGSENIFYHPYCGQPRNDGPLTRGFITNFRWHIVDDIPFDRQLMFYMELVSHDIVSRFVYARMAYLYAKPGFIDDHCTVSADDVRPMVMPVWNPVATAPNFSFVIAESAFKGGGETRLAYDPLWAGGKILMWMPETIGEKIRFEINMTAGTKDLQIYLGRMENGGKIKMYVNDQPVTLKGNETIDLSEQGRTLNRAYGTGKMEFKSGKNIVTLESLSGKGSLVGIDFFSIIEY